MSSFDLQKQIDYWKNGALSDIETAEILIEKEKLLHGLFFCHLTIEKALKAHYVKTNLQLAPKTHDFTYLLNKTNLQIEQKYNSLLGILMKYQLEGRYPENKIDSPSKEKSKDYLNQTKELLEWLVKKL